MKARIADRALLNVLLFVAKFERGVLARDLYENGPLPSHAAATAAIRKLSRAGLIHSSETATGRSTGRWWLTNAGEDVLRS